ncbi:MAG: PPC domain-containing protein [Geitlerinemataceae cyanobacterium]
MNNLLGRLSRTIAATAAIATLGFASAARAELYAPEEVPSGGSINGVLSADGIPTGLGGYAFDYVVDLDEGDRLELEAFSDSFDTILTLIGPNGATVAENDDGPDGTTNSLLYTRVSMSGRYTIRVRAFGAAGEGPFTVNLVRLRPI